MALRKQYKSFLMNSALSWVSYLGLVMLPDHGFKDFFPKYQQQCKCEYCKSLNVDWTKLSKTEKMVKALILKANIIAELNSSKSNID